MVNEMIMPKASEIGKVRATPAARKLARERDIDLEKISGSGENGRIHKEDVEQFSKIRVTPLARRIAKDRGVDLEKLVGTGVSGKITKEDVLASLGGVTPQKGVKESQVPNQPVAVSDISLASDGIEIVKMSAMRKAISKGMSQSYFTAPTFTLNYDVDMTNLIALRKQLVEPIKEKTGYKVTFTDLIGLATVKALMKKEHRFLNASLINDAQEIEVHHFVNLGIAVGLSEGLVVPVIHGAEQMSLSDFVVASSFNPIINQPNSAILGISATIDTPVAHEGEVVIRPIMGMSLTIDHRLVDGMNGAKFMLDLKALLENPLELLI